MPADGDEPIRGFTRTFFGDPDISFAKADVDLATLAVEHRFRRRPDAAQPHAARRLSQILPEHLRQQFQRRRPALVALGGYNNRTDRTNLFSQTDLVWDNRLAGIDQTLLFGFEVGRERSRNKHKTGDHPRAATRVPISEPTVDADVIFAPSPSDADNRVKATVAAAYVQDQIRLSPAFEIVAGLRFDSFSSMSKTCARPAADIRAAATLCGRRGSA